MAELRTKLAEVIAGAIGHHRDDDRPECPAADTTLGCRCPDGHPRIAFCDECAEDGWPCAPALKAAENALAFLIGLGAFRPGATLQQMYAAAAQLVGDTTEEGR